MSKYDASMDRDANYQIIGGDLPFRTQKTVTFTGAADLGAVGSVPYYTVTGDIYFKLTGKVSVDLVGDTATLEVGVSGNTATIHGQETATTLDVGDVISSDAGQKVGVALGANVYFLGGGADIIGTVGTADVTAGAIVYSLLWRPASDDAMVVAA